MARNTLYAVSLLLVLLISRQTAAQELHLAQLTESDFYEDFPVVLTATRLKQSQKNSPIATTIIDREMIEASGFTEIADLLRLAPGMLVNYDSGHTLAAGYQFLFNRYTVRFQILIDGKSVYTPLFGEMPWTQLGITIDDIERIEVIRGPSSSSYGPNAMTGVVSIITRAAVLDKGAKVKLNRGKNGRSEQFITVGNNIGNLDYKLSLGARKDDGFTERYDSKELYIAHFKADFQATNKDTITYSLNYNSGEYQEDNVFDTALHPNHIKKVKQSSHQIKWTHTLASDHFFSLNFYHQTYDDRNNYDAYGGALFMDESVRTDRHNIEFAHSIYRDSYSLTAGMIFRSDKTVAPQYLYQVADNTVNTRQLFINSEIELNQNNILNIGIMNDKNDTGDSTLSHRLSLNHHINKNHSVRASYAKATRSPFIFEEYTNYVIPGFGSVWSDLSDLDSERISSFDIGYTGWLNNNSTEVDLRLYKNRLANLILLDWSVPTGGFVEGDGFNVTGFEATVSQRFDNSRIVLNYARSKIYADDLNIAEASWFETGAPEDNISLLVMHNFSDSVKGSLGYYYTGRYQELCCEDPIQLPRKRLDLTLSKKVKLGEYNAKLKLVLQNITDEEVDTRLLNNYDRQGYVSYSMEL